MGRVKVRNSRRKIIGLFAMLLVGGCAETGGFSFAAPDAAGETRMTDNMQRASFADGEVLLVPPQGYCIDPGSIRRGPDNGFALMARCDRFGISGFFGMRRLVLLSVTVSNRKRETPPSLKGLEEVASGARVIAHRSAPDLPMIRLEGANSAFADPDSKHWRGAFLVNGHLVALGLYSGDKSTSGSASETRLLQELARKTLKASQKPGKPDPA